MVFEHVMQPTFWIWETQETRFYIDLPCIEILTLLLSRTIMPLELPCLRIFAITEAYFGASDKDLTTEYPACEGKKIYRNYLE